MALSGSKSPITLHDCSFASSTFPPGPVLNTTVCRIPMVQGKTTTGTAPPETATKQHKKPTPACRRKDAGSSSQSCALHAPLLFCAERKGIHQGYSVHASTLRKQRNTHTPTHSHACCPLCVFLLVCCHKHSAAVVCGGQQDARACPPLCVGLRLVCPLSLRCVCSGVWALQAPLWCPDAA